MKIRINFERPYFEKETILALTPPASSELAGFYIDQALAWDDTLEYSQWKKVIEEGN